MSERVVIYRCGWCGTPCSRDGGPLSYAEIQEHPHPDLYLAAHPDAEQVKVWGWCCPNGDGQAA